VWGDVGLRSVCAGWREICVEKKGKRGGGEKRDFLLRRVVKRGSQAGEGLCHPCRIYVESAQKSVRTLTSDAEKKCGERT